jgi:hypothetical protein
LTSIDLLVLCYWSWEFGVCIPFFTHGCFCLGLSWDATGSVWLFHCVILRITLIPVTSSHVRVVCLYTVKHHHIRPIPNTYDGDLSSNMHKCVAERLMEWVKRLFMVDLLKSLPCAFFRTLECCTRTSTTVDGRHSAATEEKQNKHKYGSP